MTTPHAGAWRIGETWIDREELAYNHELERSPRRGLVRCVGKLVRVRLGVPDTFFTIPAVVTEEFWTRDVDLARIPKGQHDWYREQYLVTKGTRGYVDRDGDSGEFYFNASADNAEEQ